jgi:hypothetical protein
MPSSRRLRAIRSRGGLTILRSQGNGVAGDETAGGETEAAGHAQGMEMRSLAPGDEGEGAEARLVSRGGLTTVREGQEASAPPPADGFGHGHMHSDDCPPNPHEHL